MKIFLNANGIANDVGSFLDYVAGRSSDDPFAKKLEDAVKLAKADKKLRREDDARP